MIGKDSCTRASGGAEAHLVPRLMLRLRSILSILTRAQTMRTRRIARYAFEFGLLAVALAVTRYLTIYLWKIPNGDVKLYHDYAAAFWTQRPLLHTLPVEYPALAILPFTLTLLPPIGDYMALYAYWMGALVIVGYVGFLRYSTHRRAVVYAVYLLLGATATILARFDLVPALVTLGALWATQRGRFGYAYLLIAAGVLLKLYPIFLLPIVMIAQAQAVAARTRLEDGAVEPEGISWHIWRGDPRVVARRLWERLRAHPATPKVARGALLALGTVAFGFWCATALSPSGALSGFSYASDRPLQIESTPASLLWLGTLFGIPAGPVYTFSSLNYVGPLDAALKPLSALALLAACGIVYYRQARGTLTVGRAFVACLCAVIATNKIFSPQYLIWVLPIVAAVEGFDLIWLLICALTTLDFPILYMARHQIATVPYTPAFMPVLALRNLLLIAVTVRATFGLKQARSCIGIPSVPHSSALRQGAHRVTQSEDARPPASSDSSVSRDGTRPVVLG